MKNGVDTYFELLLTNEDPTGGCRQTDGASEGCEY